MTAPQAVNLAVLPNAIFLIGPKGSGKSYIGRLLEREMGIPFLRAEPLWLAIQQAGVASEAEYLQRGMSAVVAAAQSVAGQAPAFSLETTGAFDDIDSFIDRFRPFSRPRLVQVRAGAETCLQRVRDRDRSEHIDVSDARVEEVNLSALTVQLPFELVIENDPFAGAPSILAAIRSLLQADSAGVNNSGVSR